MPLNSMSSISQASDVLVRKEHIQMLNGSVDGLWLAGVIATPIGATLTVVGLLVQKSSHQASVGIDTGHPYWLERRWLVGAGLWILGSVVCFVAEGMANQSLLACFNCCNILFVFLFAPLLAGERVSSEACVGAMLLIIGCIIVVAAGPKQYQLQTASSIHEDWRNPQFLGALLTMVMIFGTLGAWLRMDEGKRRGRSSALIFTLMSAIFAACAVLFSKCTSLLLFTSVEKFENQVFTWIFCFSLAGFIMMALSQIHFLNMALKAGDALSIIPTYEALSMTGQIVLVGTFFHEFQHFDLYSHLRFGAGLLCVIGGAGLLSLQSSRGSSPGEEAALAAKEPPAAAMLPNEASTDKASSLVEDRIMVDIAQTTSSSSSPEAYIGSEY